MAHDLVCWRCGAPLAMLTLPLRRKEECPACRAELHVCRMCQFWAPTRARRCSQEEPEEVRNKEQANFCDWFRPRPAAFDAAGVAADAAARARLDTLFGGAASRPPDDPAAAAADALFGPPGPRKG